MVANKTGGAVVYIIHACCQRWCSAVQQVPVDVKPLMLPDHVHCSVSSIALQ